MKQIIRSRAALYIVVEDVYFFSKADLVFKSQITLLELIDFHVQCFSV